MQSPTLHLVTHPGSAVDTTNASATSQSVTTGVFDPELRLLFLCHNPIDMRLGFDGVLARTIHWFGCARPHCAYAFINARGNRIKLLIHDGLGLWLAQRRLHSGRFTWIEQPFGVPVSINAAQWRALTQGLPWARIEQAITAH